jgi:hypothetical protein
MYGTMLTLDHWTKKLYYNASVCGVQLQIQKSRNLSDPNEVMKGCTRGGRDEATESPKNP